MDLGGFRINAAEAITAADGPVILRINQLIRSWTHLHHADVGALASFVARQFAEHFQEYPVCIKLIGSLANGTGHANSDIDLLIETARPGLSKFEGAGFAFFKRINGDRCPEHLTDLRATLIGTRVGDLAKAGLIDVYYRAPRRTRPPCLTLWLPPESGPLTAG